MSMTPTRLTAFGLIVFIDFHFLTYRRVTPHSRQDDAQRAALSPSLALLLFDSLSYRAASFSPFPMVSVVFPVVPKAARSPPMLYAAGATNIARTMAESFSFSSAFNTLKMP